MTLLLPPFAELALDLPSTAPFSRRMAKEAGVSSTRLSRLVAGGVVRRMVEGVYVASEVPDSLALRCAAMRLVIPEDAFVSDRTAAWIYTGSRALAPNEHLAVPPISCFRQSGRRALRGTLTRSGERAVLPRDLREVNGLLVTTELRTALDLGRLERSRDMRLWSMDNLLATGVFTHDELLAEIPRFRGQRGVVGLKVLAPLSQLGCESFGEAATRLRWHDAGLPRPQLQISITVEQVEVARLDMGLEEWLFAVEYDGEEFHSSDEQRAHDSGRRVWLRTDHNWVIKVLRKDHVFGHEQNAEVLIREAAKLARASLGQRTFFV